MFNSTSKGPVFLDRKPHIQGYNKTLRRMSDQALKEAYLTLQDIVTYERGEFRNSIERRLRSVMCEQIRRGYTH